MIFLKYLFLITLFLPTLADASYKTGFMALLVTFIFFVIFIFSLTITAVLVFKKKYKDKQNFITHLKLTTFCLVLFYVLTIAEFKSSPNSKDILYISVFYAICYLLINIPPYIQSIKRS